MKTTQTRPSSARRDFWRSMICGLPLAPAIILQARAQSGDEPVLDEGNLRAFVALARSDIRTEKTAVIAQNIEFTPDEGIDFWPLQREYEMQLEKLLDRRYELILQFARHFGTMSNKDATDLAMEVFELEGQRTSLKRKYFKKFSKVVPALKAARFFQIENQLNMVVDLQIAASLPLIQ
jgi:hypothetical protein